MALGPWWGALACASLIWNWSPARLFQWAMVGSTMSVGVHARGGAEAAPALPDVMIARASLLWPCRCLWRADA